MCDVLHFSWWNHFIISVKMQKSCPMGHGNRKHNSRLKKNALHTSILQLYPPSGWYMNHLLYLVNFVALKSTPSAIFARAKTQQNSCMQSIVISFRKPEPPKSTFAKLEQPPETKVWHVNFTSKVSGLAALQCRKY